MPDPVERGRQLRNRAEECLRLADIVWSDEVRNRYRAIAGHYAALAEAELVSVNGSKPANGPILSKPNVQQEPDWEGRVSPPDL
jgi:hypothetical protein